MRDSVQPLGVESNFLNAQIAGADHATKYMNYREMVQRWRLAYMSVTCYQDGPDLANQGSLVVAQVPTEPIVYNFSAPDFTHAGGIMAFPKLEQFTAEDRPSFTVSQGMPNAYFSRSREGAYVPLKLTETCQAWTSDASRVCTSPVTIHHGANDNAVRDLPVNGNLPGFPHTTLPAARFDSVNQLAFCNVTSPMLNGTWANISARNLAVTTSFTFFVRCGIEMQVQPQSSLAPQLQLSPPYDSVALDAYFVIARELKDAYPSDYNDLGKIWDAISAAAKTAMPILSKIPGIGPAAEGAVAVGDWIRATSSGKKPKAKSKKKKNKQPYQPKASTSKQTSSRRPKQKTQRQPQTRKESARAAAKKRDLIAFD